MGPLNLANSNWRESSRQQALMLGIPAIFIAVVGLTTLGVSQVNRQERLEPWYLSLQEKTSREKIRVLGELKNTQILGANPNQAEAEGIDSEESLEETEEKLKARLKELSENEQVYLLKLIDLDPNKPEYKFDLARSYRSQGNDKFNAIMEQLAPDDLSVYHEAHQQKARMSFGKARSAKSNAEKSFYYNKAFIHAEHCLTQKLDDGIAKEIKARVFQEQDRANEAYALYEELFEEDPAYYQPMVQLNNDRDRSALNSSLVERALVKFDAKLAQNKDGSDDTGIWVDSWGNKVRCRIIQKDFDLAVRELENEFASEPDVARKAFLKSAAGDVFSAWAGSEGTYASMSEDVKVRVLERLREAHVRNPKSKRILNQIAWFVNYSPTLAEQARKIYDPNTDLNAPSSVLSELGAKALRENDFSNAIKFFKQAISKDQNNPLILNNLAYAYLVSEQEETAAHALYLINDAIRKLNAQPDPAGYKSSLYHTRGTALMQLSRMEEAAASFEICLAGRPDDQPTIELLIQCYEGRIESQAEVYRAELDRLRALTKEMEDKKSGLGN